MLFLSSFFQSNRGVTIWSAEKKEKGKERFFLTAQMGTMEAIKGRYILRRFKQKAKKSEKVIFLCETCPIFFGAFFAGFFSDPNLSNRSVRKRKSNYGSHCQAVKSSPTFRRGGKPRYVFHLADISCDIEVCILHLRPACNLIH